MTFTAKQLDELDTFFKSAKLPLIVQLDQGSKITNVAAFIQSHLNVLRANPDRPITEPFYTRLLRLKELISG